MPSLTEAERYGSDGLKSFAVPLSQVPSLHFKVALRLSLVDSNHGFEKSSMPSADFAATS